MNGRFDGFDGDDDGDDLDWFGILEELREIRADEVDLSDVRRDRIKATWLAGAHQVRVDERARSRRRRRRWVELSASAAVILAVCAALVMTGPTRAGKDDPRVDSTDRAATSPSVPRKVPTLEELAAQALARPSEVLGEHAQYAHRVRILAGLPGAGESAEPFREETWIAVDGSGRRISGPTGPAPGADVSFGAGEMLLGGKLAPNDVLALPTDDADALIVRIAELLRYPPGPQGFGDVIGELLAEAGVPSRVRAALFQALAAEGFRPAEDQVDESSTTYEGPTRGGHLVIVVGEDTVPRSLRLDAGAGGSITTSYEVIDLRDDLG